MVVSGADKVRWSLEGRRTLVESRTIEACRGAVAVLHVTCGTATNSIFNSTNDIFQSGQSTHSGPQIRRSRYCWS